MRPWVEQELRSLRVQHAQQCECVELVRLAEAIIRGCEADLAAKQHELDVERAAHKATRAKLKREAD